MVWGSPPFEENHQIHPDTLRKSNMACCKIHNFLRCFCYWNLHLVLGFSIATFNYRRLPTLVDCYSTIGNHNGPCKDQWNISHNTMFGCHFFWHDSRFLSISQAEPWAELKQQKSAIAAGGFSVSQSSQAEHPRNHGSPNEVWQTNGPRDIDCTWFRFG